MQGVELTDKTEDAEFTKYAESASEEDVEDDRTSPQVTPQFKTLEDYEDCIIVLCSSSGCEESKPAHRRLYGKPGVMIER